MPQGQFKIKAAVDQWDEFRKSIANGTPVDKKTPSQIRVHREELEKNPEDWMKFFFPHYVKYEFAPFQKKAIKRLVNNPEWYEVLSWSRELAKSTIVMMTVMYLTLTKRKRNVILTSSTYDNAERLLEHYRSEYDSNQRISQYYGKQKKPGKWELGDFTTTGGASFIAVGAGQSPRGTRKDEVRPDIILSDDFDTDEECRNPETIKNKWQWFGDALYPTRSISEPLLVIWCGNIIAKDCCVVRAGKMADNWDIVNIRDKNGKSTWPQKNTEEHIDRVLSKIPYSSQQKEYFNNPISEGDIFKLMTWGKCPPLNSLKYAVFYADPGTSNKASSKQASFKSGFLIGQKGGTFYVYYGFLDQTSNSIFTDWFYHTTDYVNGKTQIYYYIENNSLQDPFFEQVFKPLFYAKGKETGHYIPIKGDTRKKPDKFFRIEGNLEPLNSQGRLILNEAEKNNPHFIRLEEQFKLVNEKLTAPADGPDCIEGGVFILNSKNTAASDNIDFIPRKISHTNKYRY